MMRAANLIGKKFGRLHVVSRETNSYGGKARWRCICICGGETITTTDSLRNGHTKSCGCLQKEFIINKNTTHGLRNIYEYVVWQNMMKRCYNKKSISYKNYGGRGIIVCKEWHNFYKWFVAVGQCPKPGYSLDRINNDGNYEPGNIRWATRAEQGQNTRTTRLTIGDVLDIRRYRKAGVTLNTLAEQYNVHISTIHAVEKRKSWKNTP